MEINEKNINHLRELRKLINILQTHGNCIVPSINNKETTALERLNVLTQELIDDGLTLDEIEEGIQNLEKYGYPAK